MRLCDTEIAAWLDAEKIAIIPRPVSNKIHGVTVDLLLGHRFRRFSKAAATTIDLSGAAEALSAAIDQVMGDELTLNDNERFVLQPGELALAMTFESIALPTNIVGWLDGRSSLARLGLTVHITANRIDPGWQGNIVLECFNAGQVSLALRPKMAIAALSFEQLNQAVSTPYHGRSDAKYLGQNSAIVSRFDQEVKR